MSVYLLQPAKLPNMLRLKNTKTKEIVAVLNDVKLESRLEELRARIDSELKLSNVYEFTICGTGIKTKQEQKYQLRSCVSKSADENDYCLEINFVHKNNTVSSSAPNVSGSSSGSNAKEVKENYEDNRKENKEEQIRINEGSTRRYPKFYLQEEIDEACESFEKERKSFFNEKLTEIIETSSLADWGVQEIHGVIDVHWVLKKTEILKNCVKEMIANQWSQKPPDKDSNISQQEKNMMKNFDNLEKAQFMLDNRYKRLSEKLKNDGEKNREELEKDFDQTFSELKKAQSNLTKSIEQYKLKLDIQSQMCQLSEENEERMDLDESLELSENEVEVLVASVQDDFDI